MAIALLSSFLSDLLEMDHVNTSTAMGKTTYTFKTTSVVESLVETKSKILSVLDAPFDIPEDITVRPVKRGRLYKEYLVDIVVDSSKIGRVENLLAKKYGMFRSRPYSPL